MKKVLVIYYSQSGQLGEIADCLSAPLKENPQVQVDMLEIKPVCRFPFPWSWQAFFNVFPESVTGQTVDLLPVQLPEGNAYQLIVLCYQVWYLHPSIPFNSFLLSSQAEELLRDKPVITVIGARNMWLNAQEVVKKRLKALNSKLYGNIVLIDKASNLISVVTIVYWMMTGKKKPFLNLFPFPGVSQTDIKNTGRYGEIIRHYLLTDNYAGLQGKLVTEGAVTIQPNLVLLERTAIWIFKAWAKAILTGSRRAGFIRFTLVNLFSLYLAFALFIISPLAGLIYSMLNKIQTARVKQDIEYYSDVTLINEI